MFGCESPAADFASRRNRSMKRSSLRVALVQDLDRDAAAELLVLGEVDVGHAAGAELAQDPVAAVEERVDEGVREPAMANF